MSLPVHGVHLVTDTYIQKRYNHVELASFAAEAGVPVIQFREKHLPAADMLPVVRKMRSVCEEHGCSLVVNDRVDLMMAANGHGVHLGQEDLPIEEVVSLLGQGKLIGGTASTLQMAKKVQAEGADYLGFGHIFSTNTKKKDYKPRGLETLRQITNELQIPVIAIGGIHEDNAGEVMEAGAAGFAVSSAICAADNPGYEAGKLVDIYQKYS